MSSKLTSYFLVSFVAGLVTSSACSSSSNPAGPTDMPPPASSSSSNTPPPAPTPPNPQANLTGAVNLTVNPSTVPFSGTPIPDLASCKDRNNTWFYELKLEETGGVDVTFHTKQDAFDGFVVNNATSQKIVVPAKGSLTLNSRWCSASSSKHTSQHTFIGSDANGKSISIQTPVINLMGR
jgi:hypothetical protein